MKLSRLRTNYEENPVGIAGIPAFSWVLESEIPNTMQEAFSLEILTGGERVYASGKRVSGQSVGFEPEGFTVLPAQRYQWKLHVWSNRREEAQAEAQFEGGIATWRAVWIEPANDGLRYEKAISMIMSSLFQPQPMGTVEERLMPVSIPQKKFLVKPGLKQARAYVTAHGNYQLQLNGQLPDGRHFAPECSAYEKVLYYQIYAVTELLQAGENVCQVLLADGWWGGRVGMTGEAGQYGWSRGLLLQLELVYENGETEYICSDESFQWCDDGPIRYADLSIGEKQDHNYCLKEAQWKPVRLTNYGYENLLAQVGPPVRVVQERGPELIDTPKGETVLDFGQNFAGVVLCHLRCAKGTVVTLEHAETLDEQGNVFFSVTGVNKDQKDVFVCTGTGEETFEPQFIYHGFRYVRITGLDQINPVDFLFISSLTFGIGSGMLNASSTYFATYIMGGLKLNAAASAMMIVGMLPALIAAPLLANKLGKKAVCGGGLTIAGAANLIRFLNVTYIPLWYLAYLLGGLGSGIMISVMYGIQADNVDYAEVKTGIRAEGAIASLSSFVSKAASGIGAALPAYILGWTGFVANQAQTSGATRGILLCSIGLPGLCTLFAGLLFLCAYPLGKNKMEQVESELRMRREAAAK